jgi:hypothetical protein
VGIAESWWFYILLRLLQLGICKGETKLVNHIVAGVNAGLVGLLEDVRSAGIVQRLDSIQQGNV